MVNHPPDQLAKSPNRNRFQTSGMIRRERERTRSPRSGRKRNSIRNPVAAPSFPWQIMRTWSLLSLRRLLCTGCPNLPAICPSGHCCHTQVWAGLGERLGDPVPGAANSSDDDPLSDKEPDTKSKSHKRVYTSPIDVVVVGEDDDEPLPSHTCARPWLRNQRSSSIRLHSRTPSTDSPCD